MRRLLAGVLAGLLCLSGPALAQSTNYAQPVTGTQTPILNNQTAQDDGLSALDQAPPPGQGGPDYVPYLVGGLALGGLGLGIYLANQNNNSSSPASP
jgi:hypothetical protein